MKLGTDLTKGSVLKNFILFIIPIVLSGVMQQLYNTADTLVVGKFVGDVALAAVGSTGSVTHLILNIFIGLSVGTNVICARFYGAGNSEGLSRAIHTSILLSVASGVFLAIVGFVFSKPLLALMGTPYDVIDSAALYMRIFFLGSPFSMLYNFGSAILRAAGDTKRPFYIMLISGVVNVALNLFCVLVLKIGVAGVAIGTIASQFVSAVMVIYILVKSNGEFNLNLKKLRLYKRELGQIMAIGIPSGLNGIMFSLSNVIIQSTVNSFGKAAVAGQAAASNIETYGFLLQSSVEQGAVSFAGQNMGAKKFNRVRRTAVVALCSSLFFAFAYMAVSFFAGDVILGLFADEASRDSVIQMGLLKLLTSASGFFLIAPMQALCGVLKGMGKVISVTAINAFFICFMRVLWIAFIFPLNPVLKTVYLSHPVSWALSSTAITIVYFIERRKILKNPVAPQISEK